MHKGARGFTLIELLVVIAIIGLLMTIIMVSLGSAKAKSRDARRQADIKNIQLALAVYYNENGMYPKNIYSTSGVAPSNGLAPNYLPTVPKDPNGSATCTNSGVAGCYKYIAYTPGTTGAGVSWAATGSSGSFVMGRCDSAGSSCDATAIVTLPRYLSRISCCTATNRG